MLICGRQLRFTGAEMERHAGIGLDLRGIGTIGELSRAVEVWALNMYEIRPDLVRKLAEMLGDCGAEEPGETEASRKA